MSAKMGNFGRNSQLNIDLWSTGYRGHIVQRPLVEALQAAGKANFRVVYCGQSPGLGAMQKLSLPECHTACARTLRDLPHFPSEILKTRHELSKFYSTGPQKRIVHITMASPWDQFYIDIAKKSGAKILLVVHDAQRHIGEKNFILDRLDSRLIGLADDVAVLTPYAGEVLSKRLGNKKRIHVVSPGLVMNAEAPAPPRTAPMGRPTRFLFFGRLHAYKGLDILLEAWSQFKTQRPNSADTLSIVGSGNIEPYRKALDANKDVLLEHGWISDARMAEVFSQHDVNVLPYLEGSESATALAGMWAGIPAIATRIGCFAEKLFDRENALLTDVNSTHVAAAIAELASSELLYNQLADGTYRIAQRWAAPAVAQSWLTLYENIWSRANW
jgi:glycosyltransferase involved in cell wall biosynthesis